MSCYFAKDKFCLVVMSWVLAVQGFACHPTGYNRSGNVEMDTVQCIFVRGSLKSSKITRRATQDVGQSLL